MYIYIYRTVVHDITPSNNYESKQSSELTLCLVSLTWNPARPG